LIYFMQPVDGGPIKIGFSDNVEVRHRQLEAHYGKPLAILATMPGDPTVEAKVHERFAHLRLGEQGKRGRQPEQFRPAPDLMEFIGRPLLVCTNPDAVEAMESADSRAIVVSMKGTVEFRDWLNELAEYDRSTAVQVIEKCAVLYAKTVGFTRPAPKRTGGR
jgi:Meiotically Up-regulated Gene 113 (MUG113) protein